MKDYELVEYIARYLCDQAYEDPDEYYEDFNRDAAANVNIFGEYEGCRDHVFPKVYRWVDYEEAAYSILAFCRMVGIDVLSYVNKFEEDNK